VAASAERAGRDESRVRARRARIHALLGVGPLALFVVVHSATSLALRGDGAAWASWARVLDHVPLLRVFEALLVLLPLSVHALLGLARWRDEPVALRQDPSRALQRFTGLVLLAWVPVHLAQGWWRRAAGISVAEDLPGLFVARLSTTVAGGVPVYALIDLAACGAASFHVAAGLPRALERLAWVRGEPALRRARAAASALGFALFALSAWTLVELAGGPLELPAFFHG
jgi:succinate dehydrogenase / fumarate reductase, cytochrome b subunit